MNVFREAGKKFLNDYDKHSKGRARAVAELDTLQKVCEMGISHFYKTVTDGGQPDVYVTRKHENAVIIEYGLRPCGYGSVKKGPVAVILATSEGEIIAAKNSKWLPNASPDAELKGNPINIDSWDMDVSQFLIEFMQESETEYRRLSH